MQFVSIFVLVGALACGGKPAPSPPESHPDRDVYETAAPVTPGWTEREPPGTLELDEVAPSPVIRVGLFTNGDSVRFTSPLPLRIRAGRQWATSNDVLVEMHVDGGEEVSSYQIQVASFLALSAARDFLASFEAEALLSGRIQRETGTGRYAVRVGNWGTVDGARASIDGLKRLGYEAARVVPALSSRRRPTGLVLRPTGAEPFRTRQLSLAILPASPGAWVEIDGEPYRGYVELAVNSSNRMTVVNVLNLEDYLKGVVPAELSPAVFPELEAIKAQAVAARTYALRHLGQFVAEGFDICSSPACQVYGGVGVEQPMANDAVAETAGEVLTYEGALIDALYTSTCGGRTEDVQNVFEGDAQPYLVSRSCFIERPATLLNANVKQGLSWQSAGAVVSGLVRDEELEGISLQEPVTASELSQWAMRALGRLGQRPCRPMDSGGDRVSVAQFARTMTEALCWDGRVPFLLSDWDTNRLVPPAEAEGISDVERRALAYWIHEQWLHPSPEGLRPRRALSREEVMESLFRLLVGRGEPLLLEATFMGIQGDELIVNREEDRDREEDRQVMTLADRRYLFRRVNDSTFFAPSLSMVPGDRFSYHEGPQGIDLIILLSNWASFDRSSRFFRWTVRKTADELSRAVNGREALGRIVELKPLRYGRSGRVVELTIVGTDASKTLRGLDIRRWLGIRENLFYVDRQFNESGDLEAWVFTGGGWGHGVGLCQVGAYGMAASGLNYRDILGHYYPGTRITPLDEPGRLSK